MPICKRDFNSNSVCKKSHNEDAVSGVLQPRLTPFLLIRGGRIFSRLSKGPRWREKGELIKSFTQPAEDANVFNSVTLKIEGGK